MVISTNRHITHYMNRSINAYYVISLNFIDN